MIVRDVLANATPDDLPALVTADWRDYADGFHVAPCLHQLPRQGE